MMLPSSDFDWHGEDAQAVILEEQSRTAVYSNSRGNIVIRQQSAWDEDCDAIIIVLPENIGALIAALKAEARRVFPDTRNSGCSSGAERSRKYRERKRKREIGVTRDAERDGESVTVGGVA